MIVRFPIAGVPSALPGFLVWLVSRRESGAKADTAPFAVAAGAAVVAVSRCVARARESLVVASMMAFTEVVGLPEYCSRKKGRRILYSQVQRLSGAAIRQQRAISHD